MKWIGLFFASATLGASAVSSAYAGVEIRWSNNGDTTVCAVDSYGRGECDLAVPQMLNSDLLGVIRINAGLPYPAQWIEIRSQS